MNMRNSVLLMGNLGSDPEFSKFENGRMLARISLATNETYRNKNGDTVTKTEWHRCIAWGKTAELMNKLLNKGKRIAVRGKLTYSAYEDKEGVQRYSTEIVVDEFELMDGGATSSQP